MRRFTWWCVVVSVAAGSAAGEVSFTRPPTAKAVGEQVEIAFAVSAPTDVAVWVLDAKGQVVRHLAAGVLGPNAPEPLAKDRLSQTLVWDGADDTGQAVPKGTYTVRVGLGTTAAFDRLIGHEPQWLGNVYALAVGTQGEVYAYTSRGLVVLDREGRYQRQIVPAPADLPAEKLAGLELVTLADGSRYFQRDYPLPGSMIGSMALTAQGELLLPGAGRYDRSLVRIGTDGSVPKHAFDKKLTKFSDVGFLHLAASPDGRVVYMSGAEAGYQGDDARRVCYRQAVYRLDLLSDGPAEIFTGDDENSGGPSFSVNRPKGLACDPTGHLYVCNQRGGNIAVYTPGGGMIRALKVKNPQRVAVHPTTGQVYVLAGAEQGYTQYGYDYPPTMTEARLLRLSSDGDTEAELVLPEAFVRTGKTRPGPAFTVSMACDFNAEKPIVWLGISYPGAEWSKWRLFRIEDQGQAFGTPREVCPKPEGALLGAPLQLALGRSRDLLYVNNGSSALQRFTGDGRPLDLLTLRHPETKERYYIAEFAISRDGTINTMVWTGQYGYRNTVLARFTPEGQLIPWPGGEDRGQVTRSMKGASGTSNRGFAVGPDGSFYVMYYDTAAEAREGLEPWDAAFSMKVAVGKFHPDGTPANMRLISHLRAGGQCIRVDRRGHLYVGDNLMPVGVAYPQDFAGVLPDPLARVRPAMLKDGSFDPLLRWMGSVIKFGPEGGRIAGLPEGYEAPAASAPGDLYRPMPAVHWFLHNNHRLKVTGAEWQFHGFAPLPAQYQGVTHVERCVCRAGRFDLDEFDRLFVPDNRRHRVTVLDSAGNVVTRFGTYGNQDSAGPAIHLTDPWWVAAAADRAYIGEALAGRIVKVRLTQAIQASCPVVW